MTDSVGSWQALQALENRVAREEVRAKERVEAAFKAAEELADMRLKALRDHVDTMFTEKDKALQAALLAQEKAVKAALEASDKAIDKAERNAEKWRDSANEWRGAMSDRDRELPSRREVEQAVSALEGRLTAVERRQDFGGGKAEATERTDDSAMTWKIALIGFAITVVLAVIVVAVNVATSS